MMQQIWNIIWNAFNGVMNTVFETFHQKTGLFWICFGLFAAYTAIRFFILPFLKHGMSWTAGSDSVYDMSRDLAYNSSTKGGIELLREARDSDPKMWDIFVKAGGLGRDREEILKRM